MAITITKLIHIILVGVVAVAMFGFLSMIVAGISGESFACRLSITLVSLNIGDRVNCRVSEVEMPPRIVQRDEIGRFLAEEMLECWALFGGGSISQLRSQNLVETRSIVPRALSGHLPDGRLFQGGSWNDIRNTQSFCMVCSVITFPEGESFSGVRESIALEQYRGKTFAEHLYPASEAYDQYFEQNSDEIVPSGLVPATALVFYTEGRYGSHDLNGVLLMDSSDFQTMFEDGNRGDSEKNYCQRYLS